MKCSIFVLRFLLGLPDAAVTGFRLLDVVDSALFELSDCEVVLVDGLVFLAAGAGCLLRSASASDLLFLAFFLFGRSYINGAHWETRPKGCVCCRKKFVGDYQ